MPFDRGLHDRLPEPSQWTKVVEEKIRDWQRWTSTHRSPASYDPSTNAVMLMDRRTHGVVGDVLEECLRGGGYDPAYCDPERLRSNDAFRQLREAGLVIADFSECSPRFEQLYAAVHGLAIPSVRLLASDAKALPWILDGEPRGFPRDLVRWNAAADLPALLKPRIAAMFDIAAALDGNKGTTYLQSKRYAQFYVFISHTLKPPQRQLVDRIYARLGERQVEPLTTSGQYRRDRLEGGAQRIVAEDDALRCPVERQLRAIRHVRLRARAGAGASRQSFDPPVHDRRARSGPPQTRAPPHTRCWMAPIQTQTPKPSWIR